MLFNKINENICRQYLSFKKNTGKKSKNDRLKPLKQQKYAVCPPVYLKPIKIMLKN